MKLNLVAATAALALAGSFMGCSKGSAPASSSSSSSSSAKKSIRVFNIKVEIDSQLKDFAKAYEDKTGVHVEIESSGGGADNQGILKGYKASDNMPDIFVFEGPGHFAVWHNDMTSLDGEAWTKDTAAAYTDGGHVYGFPYAVEGYGLAYNADLLEKAGIDPASLTSYAGYKAAFEKLNSMKSALGIDSVVSMTAGVAAGMTWVTGTHNFGVYLSAGLSNGDEHIVNDALEGKVDRARLTDFADYVKLLFDYSDQTVLLTGNYDQQLQAFQDGKAVFLHQGNWVDPSLTSAGTNFKMAFAPHAFSKSQKIDGIQVGAPSWWAVYKDGNVEEAKKFLNEFSQSSEGRDARINKMSLISPFTSDSAKPSSPLSASVADYVSRGKTYPWEQFKMPDGFTQDTLGPIYELLAQNKITTTQFVDMVADAIATVPSLR
ncbi:MAG: extracellular solute-binding protein [Treponema sp.]|nr:extracellular solute-binding protein [Treponema sp.]